jgi:hypothetical protein
LHRVLTEGRASPACQDWRAHDSDNTRYRRGAGVDYAVKNGTLARNVAAIHAPPNVENEEIELGFQLI